MITQDEIWKDIPGYEGLYQASSYGNIKSTGFTRECFDINNNCFNGKKRFIKGKVLKPRMVRGNRQQVTLCKNGVLCQKLVHRLVALTFIPNPGNLPEVNHKDENPLNNSVWVNPDGSVDESKSNLEWCDRTYNNNYGTRNTRVAKALSRKVAQYNIDGELIKVWNSQQEIQRVTKFLQCTISDCCNGKQKTAYGYKWKFYEEGN